MEEPVDKNSFGEALQELRTSLGKVGIDGLGLNETKDTRGAIHGLGPTALSSAMIKIKGALSTLTEVAGTRDVWVDRFYHELGRSKGDLAQQSKKLEQLKKSLKKAAATCARDDPFAPPGFRLSRQVRLAAENAGLECAEDTPMDGAGFGATGEVLDLTVYSKTFLIGIRFQANSTKTNVKFTHVNADESEQAADPAVNADIERLLQQGKLEEFEQSLGKLMDLEALEGRLGQFRLKDSLRSQEEYLFTVEQCEKNTGALVSQRLSLGHGMIRRNADGLVIKYHGSAGALARIEKNQRTVSEEELFNYEGLRSVSLGVEDSYTAKTIARGSQSPSFFPPASGSLPLDISFAQKVTASAEAVYVLRLDSPIVCSCSLAASLFALANPERSEVGIPWTEKGTRLQVLLCPEIFNEPAADVLCNVSLDDGTVIAFSHSVDNRCLGASVARIPFLHPGDIGRALRLLRQQAVFNDLFVSCFKPNIDSADTSRGRLVFPTEVVISEPPSYLQLSISSARSEGTTMTLGVSVQPNGIISATLQDDNAWGCSDETATALLTACKNIPQAIFFMMRAGANTMNTMS